MTTQERTRHSIRAIAGARDRRVLALEARNVPMPSIWDLVGQTRSVGGALGTHTRRRLLLTVTGIGKEW